MNRHVFLDRLTAVIGALASGRDRFFSRSIDSPDFSEHLAGVTLEMRKPARGPDEGVQELRARTLVGELDPAYFVAQYRGSRRPTVVYHHGNAERPFDFRRSSKNTFKTIFVDADKPIEANVIGLRAPFHNGPLREYQQKISHLSNFMAMLAVSVSLIDELVTHFRRSGSQAVVVSGISLGGWVTNLHRTYRGAADLYAPLLAGAALGDLFLTSIYRRMAGRLALDNPDTIRRALNFEVDFMRKAEDDVRPLLGRFDQFIRYERQKRCYGDRPITVLDKGHITGALSAGDLRRHILSCIDGHR